MTTGLVWVRETSPVKQANLYMDSGVGILIGALVGSRITFVFSHWDYFRDHWQEIPQLHLGGFSWAGIVLGWMAAVWIASRLLHRPMFELSDDFLPLAGCLVIGIWLGCWFDGIAYGFLANTWWSLPAIDEWGTITRRFPVQFIGALSTLIWMIGIDSIKTHPVWKHRAGKPGQSTAMFLSITSLTLCILTFFREDTGLVWKGLRLDFWVSLGFFISGVLFFVAMAMKHRMTEHTSDYLTSGS